MSELAREMEMSPAEEQRAEQLARARSFGNSETPPGDYFGNHGGKIFSAEDNRNTKSLVSGGSSASRRAESLKSFVLGKDENNIRLKKGLQDELLKKRNAFHRSAGIVPKGKTVLKAATPWGAPQFLFSVFTKANIFSDWPYSLALMAAILKDIFDIALLKIQAVATITVVFASAAGYFAIIVSILTTIFIGMMIILGDMMDSENDGGHLGKYRAIKRSKFFQRGSVVMGSFIFETFGFVVNTLPIETFAVLALYVLVLLERKVKMDLLKKAS